MIVRRGRKPSLQKAYEKCLSFEMCDDLIGKFARKSAKSADELGDVRFRYSEIIIHLRRCEPRSVVTLPKRKTVLANLVRAGGSRDALAAALSRPRPKRFGPSLSESWRERYLTDKSAGDLISELECSLRDYLDCLIETKTERSLMLAGRTISADLAKFMVKEWVRDPKALKSFLTAVLRRWREIDAPDSRHRLRVVVYQISPLLDNDRKRIVDHLQKIGVIPQMLTSVQLRSWLNIIGQHISRDAKSAADKNFGFGR